MTVSGKGTLLVDGKKIEKGNVRCVFMTVFAQVSLHHVRGEDRKDGINCVENDQRALFCLFLYLAGLATVIMYKCHSHIMKVELLTLVQTSTTSLNYAWSILA